MPAQPQNTGTPPADPNAGAPSNPAGGFMDAVKSVFKKSDGSLNWGGIIGIILGGLAGFMGAPFLGEAAASFAPGLGIAGAVAGAIIGPKVETAIETGRTDVPIGSLPVQQPTQGNQPDFTPNPGLPSSLTRSTGAGRQS